MQEPQCLVFGQFRLDLRDERLWRGHAATPLSPKTFEVLRCLVSQAGHLVTKDALLEAVWPATVVSESILTVAIRTLRRVLGDQARTPRFIETVHGRGYRFIAPVSVTISPERSAMIGSPRRPLPATVSGQPLLVGEIGLGKPAVVEAVVAQVRVTEEDWVGHGQCMDRYGMGEAYLPILEA